MVEWSCRKERLNERGLYILVELACANKRNKSVGTLNSGRMVVRIASAKITESKGSISSYQFVIFKPLSFCFEETIWFDVKVSIASRPVSRLIRWYNNQVIWQKNFDKRLFSSTRLFMDWKSQTDTAFSWANTWLFSLQFSISEQSHGIK